MELMTMILVRWPPHLLLRPCGGCHKPGDGIGATSQLMLGATSQLTEGDVFSIAGTVCLAPQSWDVGPAHIISFRGLLLLVVWAGAGSSAIPLA